MPCAYDEKSNRHLAPLNEDDKILIYERQVKEWFLNRASRLLRGKRNNFIVFMIAISYIEGVEQYKRGESSEPDRGNRIQGRSKEFFRDSIKKIFNLSEDDNTLDDFYSQVRCGLFHNGMTKDKVIINNGFQNPIDFSEQDKIKINPKLFLSKVKDDFKSYIRQLKDPRNIDERDKFDRMYKIV